MTHSKIYLVSIFTLLTVFLYSCSSITDSTQQNEINSEVLNIKNNAKKQKVDVCHYDADLDTYKLINIAQPAVNAHEKHGDGFPGEAVPGEVNYVFDDSCSPEPVPTECSDVQFLLNSSGNQFLLDVYSVDNTSIITKVEFITLDNVQIGNVITFDNDPNGNVSGNIVLFESPGVFRARITLEQSDSNISDGGISYEVTRSCSAELTEFSNDLIFPS